MIISECILQMLTELLPAFWLIVGLWIGIMVMKIIVGISDFGTLGKTNVPIKRVPSWVILVEKCQQVLNILKENKDHARTLEYHNRIHHHRARIASKRCQRCIRKSKGVKHVAN